MLNQLKKNLKAKGKLLYHQSLDYLLKAYKVIGYIFLGIGVLILKKERRYCLITQTVENLLSSVEIDIKVTSIIEQPLFVRFFLKIQSSNFNRINFTYFTNELIHQLGCNYSDLDLNLVKKEEGYNLIYLDITKTAISNLEKGVPHHRADFLEEQNADWLLEKAIELSKNETVTISLLQEKFDISKFRAKMLYDQLLKSGALELYRQSRKVN